MSEGRNSIQKITALAAALAAVLMLAAQAPAGASRHPDSTAKAPSRAPQASADAGVRQDAPSGLRYRMLEAEDARVATREAAGPILAALGRPDTAMARIAVRALGRLELPLFIPELRRALIDTDPGVRAEAANALAQLGLADPAGVLRALHDQLRAERDSDVRAALYDALGRLPFASNADRQAVEQAMAEALRSEFTPTIVRAGITRGLDSLVRGARGTGFTAGPETIRALRREVVGSSGSGWVREEDARVRRLALSALSTLAAVDDTFARAIVDPDPQVRRQVVAGVAGQAPAEIRDGVVAMGLVDASPMVKYEALRLHGRRYAAADCSVEIESTRDGSAGVALLAIDLLATSCPGDSRATVTLGGIVKSLAAQGAQAAATWHAPAHGLVALAKRSPDTAKPELAAFAGHAVWQVRMYAARAAAVLQDGATLDALATDANPNVREAAIEGLSKVKGRAADARCLAALERPDYQVVRAAAAALKGTPARAETLAACLKALGALSAAHRDTSRDPRLALLERIGEAGAAANAPALRPYLADPDPRIAAAVAEILTTWTGKAVAPRTTRLSTLPLPPVQELRDLPPALRFSLASGRRFVVRLFIDETPVSVWRIVRLARAGYYDGLTFHRVVPNFVVQGGSPGANEFVGDGPFMRDEFGTRSQTRGTIGVSSRGRDTGDAQFYINLIDNPRLDHQYTIFGEVSEGMDVVDTILEGDVIARVELVASTDPGPPGRR